MSFSKKQANLIKKEWRKLILESITSDRAFIQDLSLGVLKVVSPHSWTIYDIKSLFAGKWFTKIKVGTDSVSFRVIDINICDDGYEITVGDSSIDYCAMVDGKIKARKYGDKIISPVPQMVKS
jgi:hypothetical protein